MTGTSPIVLTNVSYTYAGNLSRSLTNISVAFERSVITTVIGTTGSGKSTLLQLMNGQLKPTSGSVKVFGEEIDYRNNLTMRRKIGYVVQGGALFPHLSVERNICLPSRIEGRSKDIKRCDDLMAMMKLPLLFKDRYPHELSGGEQQRVAICRALYSDPQILLMDESFGALDSITRKELQLQLLELHKTGNTTIIFVTHDVREAFTLGDYILILHEGKIEQYGSRDEVARHPANAFVERLVTDDLSQLR